MQHSSPPRLAVLAAALGLAVLVAPAAHAFTIDQQSNTTSNGSARYTDPDERFSGSGSGQTIQQGNATIRFGGQPQSFDQRYNSNQFFDSVTRPGNDR